MSKQRKPDSEPELPGGPHPDELPLVHPGSDDEAETAPEKALAVEAEQGGLPHWVTPLIPVEQQVGMHVLTALRTENIVAVVSTVALGGDGVQRIVSIGLDQEMLGEVDAILQSANEVQTNRVPCVGFHCRLKDRDNHDDDNPPKKESSRRKKK